MPGAILAIHCILDHPSVQHAYNMPTTFLYNTCIHILESDGQKLHSIVLLLWAWIRQMEITEHYTLQHCVHIWIRQMEIIEHYTFALTLNQTDGNYRALQFCFEVESDGWKLQSITLLLWCWIRQTVTQHYTFALYFTALCTHSIHIHVYNMRTTCVQYAFTCI